MNPTAAAAASERAGSSRRVKANDRQSSPWPLVFVLPPSQAGSRLSRRCKRGRCEWRRCNMFVALLCYVQVGTYNLVVCSVMCYVMLDGSPARGWSRICQVSSTLSETTITARKTTHGNRQTDPRTWTFGGCSCNTGHSEAPQVVLLRRAAYRHEL